MDSQRRIIIAGIAGWLLTCPSASHAFEVGHLAVLNAPNGKPRAELLVQAGQQERILSIRLAKPAEYKRFKTPLPATLKGTETATRIADLQAHTRITFARPLPDKPVPLLVVVASDKLEEFRLFTIKPGITPVISRKLASIPKKEAPEKQTSVEALGNDLPVPQEVRIREGDGLESVVRALGVRGVTASQVMAAIFQHNPDHFRNGNMHEPIPGGALRVPSLEEIRAIPDREARVLSQTHLQKRTAAAEATGAKGREPETVIFSAQPMVAGSGLENVLVRMQTQLDELTQMVKVTQVQQTRMNERLTALENSPANNGVLVERVTALEKAVKETPLSGGVGGDAAAQRETRRWQPWSQAALAVGGAMFALGMVWLGMRWNRHSVLPDQRILDLIAREYPWLLKEKRRDAAPGDAAAPPAA
ncbi:MAG: hypothetical protein HQL96_08500 [Magnetococcales bacterium]|nr:hypothetical protein [Magnetococcales bacterium]